MPWDTLLKDAWGDFSTKRLIGVLAFACLAFITLSRAAASDALVNGLTEITMVCVVGVASERFSKWLGKPPGSE